MPVSCRANDYFLTYSVYKMSEYGKKKYRSVFPKAQDVILSYFVLNPKIFSFRKYVKYTETTLFHIHVFKPNGELAPLLMV